MNSSSHAGEFVKHAPRDFAVMQRAFLAGDWQRMGQSSQALAKKSQTLDPHLTQLCLDLVDRSRRADTDACAQGLAAIEPVFHRLFNDLRENSDHD